jgi:hypothetical protein
MIASAGQVRSGDLRVVLLIGTLFLLPLAAAFCMYYGVGYRPAHHTNHGELIEPARALPASATIDGTSAFRRVWSLVYVGAHCDEACEHSLYVMRQTHLALNNDADRVQRVFIASAEPADAAALARDHPGLLIVDASGARGDSFLPRIAPMPFSSSIRLPIS